MKILTFQDALKEEALGRVWTAGKKTTKLVATAKTEDEMVLESLWIQEESKAYLHNYIGSQGPSVHVDSSHSALDLLSRFFMMQFGIYW